MNKFRFTFRLFVIATFLCAFASMAQAQATRTWVSGVGDDVNPCSRTAPCKTFAGAISKTANNGEIDALDPGGFGAVTITKSITIDGTNGAGFGSILAAGTNGVNVNDGATATPNTIVVALRNLSIQGAGTGTNGVRFVAGKRLTIEGCTIAGFRGGTGHGVDIALTGVIAGNQNVSIKDTIIRDNLGSGVRASNTGVGGAVLVALDNVRIDGNARGFQSSTSCRATITNSWIALHSTAGIEIAAGSLEVDIDTCVIASNSSGIVAAASTARIANCRITGNGNGINFTGGAVQSFGDNKVKGNGTDQNGGAVANVPAPIKI